MRGGVVVERQQHVPVTGQLVDRLGVLGAELPGEVIDRSIGVTAGFSFVDLMQRCLRRAVQTLG